MRVAWTTIALIALAGGAQAEGETSPGLTVELNTLAEADGGCQVTFVMTNRHQSPIEKAVFETVLFNKAGTVDRLTLFDFGALPSGRPRVRQFVIPDLECSDLGQILINGANTCDAPDLAPGACMQGLSVHSRATVELTG